MTRTRTALVLALVVSSVGVPAALASPACSKPGAEQLHAVHEAGEGLPLVGQVVSDRAHQAEERYCEL